MSHFEGKKTCKVKVSIVKIANDLFRTDWLELSDLWDLPINLSCKNLNGCPSKNNSSEDLKKFFFYVFASTLGKATSMHNG